MNKLKLAEELSVPLDIVTEALAWIGARGSGKTHGCGKLVELLIGAQVPVVVLDPVGVWYGLRIAKDGKGAGLSIPVFGGLHGDIPLEPTAGALIADLIVDRNLSAILDVSQFDTDAQKARFTADFAERLFRRKKKDPSVIHWVVDEAQEFVPQNPQPGEQMMLHHMQRVLKLGRNFGIGVSLLTQRPQETSKKALNQCQTVLAFRVTGPQERKAMKDWIAAHDLDQSLIEKLPSLETGSCHVWSPAFLKVSKEIHILPKDTFDASATPKFGQRRATRELAPIDLERIRTDMAATIEKAKAEDPKAMRAEIVALKRQVALGCVPDVRLKVERVEVPVLKDGQLKRFEATVCGIEKANAKTLAALGEMMLNFKRMAERPAPFAPVAAMTVRTKLPDLQGKVFNARPAPVAGGDDLVYDAARGPILDALAVLESIGTDQAERSFLALMSGKSPKSSGFGIALGGLAKDGYVSYPTRGLVQLTPEGRRLARPLDKIASSADIHDRVKGKLPQAARDIFSVVLSEYPNPITREQLAEKAGASLKSSGFGIAIGLLRSFGVIDFPDRGQVVASGKMFLEAR